MWFWWTVKHTTDPGLPYSDHMTGWCLRIFQICQNISARLWSLIKHQFTCVRNNPTVYAFCPLVDILCMLQVVFILFLGKKRSKKMWNTCQYIKIPESAALADKHLSSPLLFIDDRLSSNFVFCWCIKLSEMSRICLSHHYLSIKTEPDAVCSNWIRVINI